MVWEYLGKFGKFCGIEGTRQNFHDIKGVGSFFFEMDAHAQRRLAYQVLCAPGTLDEDQSALHCNVRLCHCDWSKSRSP